MRLIEIMISLDQVVNPTPDTHWSMEEHLTLLADIRIWLYDYRKYVEELIRSKKIKNPEFEIWAMQDQNFPNVSEDEFMKWIKEY